MSDEADDALAKDSGASAPWRTNLVLFVATVASVFGTGFFSYRTEPGALAKSAAFAGTLLTILVAHELGHYVAARIHKVDASLPFFLPLPILSPFGTMGAVIRMRGTIPTRRALLDIGAAGPLAGLVFALPLFALGVHQSTVIPVTADMGQLGDSLVARAIEHLFAPPIPEGSDLLLSPVAFGAWGGMFVTMINLLPVAQLDGGHVAYALFGSKQDRYSLRAHRAMLVFFFVIVIGHVGRDVAAGLGVYRLGRHLANAIFWLVWFEILAVLGLVASNARDDEVTDSLGIRTRAVALAGLIVVAWLARTHGSMLYPLAFFAGLGVLLAMEVRGGVLRRHHLLDHPPTSVAPLDKGRAAIAIATLVIFVLLFMPEPFSM